jgi:allatostatin receptor
MDKLKQYDILEKYGCNATNITCMHEIAKQINVLLNERSTIHFAEGVGLYNELLPEEHVRFYTVLWTIIVPILFSMIIFIGVVGNGLVIAVIIRTKKLHTSTNKFLVNLALSDILFLACCVPFQTYKFASLKWPFGEIWCKIIQYLLFISTYVTIWTLVCIAGIRYVILVKRNSRVRMLLNGMCVEICMCLWIVMFFVHVPTFNAHKVNDVQDYNYCGIVPNLTEPVLLSFFICAYLVPLGLISIFYLLVIYHLKRNS